MKPWYLSKTIWANLIGLVAAVGTAAGVDLGLTLELQGQLVGAILAAVNVALRLLTATAIRKPGGGGGGAAIAALFLLTGCYVLGGQKIDCSTDPCSSAEMAVVKVTPAGAAAFREGLAAGNQINRDANERARANFDTAIERERQLDARIADIDRGTAEVVSYDNVARKLLAAMAEGSNPPTEEFPIAGADKAAIKDVVRRRRAGELTDAQARDAMLEFITKYGLEEE